MQKVINVEDFEKIGNELDKKIEEGEDDIKNGRTHKLRDVLKELRNEYGY